MLKSTLLQIRFKRCKGKTWRKYHVQEWTVGEETSDSYWSLRALQLDTTQVVSVWREIINLWQNNYRTVQTTPYPPERERYHKLKPDQFLQKQWRMPNGSSSLSGTKHDVDPDSLKPLQVKDQQAHDGINSHLGAIQATKILVSCLVMNGTFVYYFLIWSQSSPCQMIQCIVGHYNPGFILLKSCQLLASYCFHPSTKYLRDWKERKEEEGRLTVKWL